MGKNVYVTPKNRGKWHEEASRGKAPKPSGGDSAKERARALAEKYRAKQEKKK